MASEPASGVPPNIPPIGNDSPARNPSTDNGREIGTRSTSPSSTSC